MDDNTDKRSNIIEGINDLFWIWKDEFKKVFRDSGVMIFFFLVPFGYPLLYSFIYTNEVVRNSQLVVVDKSDSFLSREFTRRMDATPDVKVVAVTGDMAEAKKMLDKKEAYGILLFPERFSYDVHRGKQTTVSLYIDMGAMLNYKNFLVAATEISLDMGHEYTAHSSPASTDELQRIKVDPVPYESVAIFNSQNGFASFLVPAILMVIIQQTLLLGVGMLGGTARERNRFHCLVPINKHFQGALRIVLGKGLTYLIIYSIVCLWVIVIVPKLFSFPQVGEPIDIFVFFLPYLLACIFLAMTLSGFMTTREQPMIVLVFTSVILVFISGISWPAAAIPPFWKALGYIFPSTPGIQGFVRMNTTGAELTQVAAEYRLLWFQAGIYFLSACLIYRYQIIRCHKLIRKQYRFLKVHRGTPSDRITE